jgi:type I restriction enzyme S subunit
MSQYDNLRDAGHQGQISHLNLGYVKQFRVPIPTRADQQEIVTSLGAVESKLRVEENRKRALDTLFRTLLHNLMTGAVRVPPDGDSTIRAL